VGPTPRKILMAAEKRDSGAAGEQIVSLFRVREARIGFVVGFLLMLPFGLWLFPRWPAARISQPIAFNHSLHADSGLECRDCHPGAFDAAAPGLPTNSICADCHEEPMSDSADEQQLLALLGTGDAIAWQSLFRQPAHVYFSHRRHTTSAELDCEVCHGSIGLSTAPPRREPQKLSMEECMSCHEETSARNDCTACHR